MQNSIDRQRLLRQFGQEPVHPAALVAKCAAGLAIVAGIALIGISTPPDLPAAANNATPAQREAEQPHIAPVHTPASACIIYSSSAASAQDLVANARTPGSGNHCDQP